MRQPQFRLITGDPYLCEQALAARESALRTEDPGIERHGLFADEIDVASLDIELRSCSLFALGRHFVLRRVEKTRSAKTLAEVVTKPLAAGTYLTLMAGSLTATHAVLKAAKAADALVSLPTPKGAVLQRAARSVLEASGLALPNTVVRSLLAGCGDDLMSLHQEVRKLQAFAGGGPMPEQAAEALCFNHTEATVYPFYDRLGEGQLAAALQELEGLREDSTRVLGGIIRHLTRLVMVRLLLDRRQPVSEISSKIGMQDWLCKRLIGQAKRHTLSNLSQALRLGVKLDQRIKQGQIAPDDALMQLILNATSPG